MTWPYAVTKTYSVYREPQIPWHEAPGASAGLARASGSVRAGGPWRWAGASKGFCMATTDKQSSTAGKLLMSQELKSRGRIVPLPPPITAQGCQTVELYFYISKPEQIILLLALAAAFTSVAMSVSLCPGLLPGPLCFLVFMVFSVIPISLLAELLLSTYPSASPWSSVRWDAWCHHTSWKHSFSALASISMRYFS